MFGISYRSKSSCDVLSNTENINSKFIIIKNTSYLAHICVLRNKNDYTDKNIYYFRVCSKYPLKMQNRYIRLSNANMILERHLLGV